MEKTNVMRILDQKKIKYNSYSYADTDAVSGIDVARVLNQDPKRVFKTLVTVANSKKNYVFVIPVEKELNLKKAAKVAGEKKIEMLKSKELLPLTGYIHGGCSPIGGFTGLSGISSLIYDKNLSYEKLSLLHKEYKLYI